MDSRRTRRILWLALLLSLAVHALIALNVHPQREPATPGVERVFIERRPLVIAKAPTPPPTPRPTPRPVASPAPAVSAPPHAKPRGTGHGRASSPPARPAAPTPSPRPVPSAPTCTQTSAPAALLATPSPPILPVAARAAGTSGTTIVTVALDPHGTVIGTSLAQSSGNPALDAIATQLAVQARYAPAVRACRAVAGTYAFSVEFAAW